MTRSVITLLIFACILTNTALCTRVQADPEIVVVANKSVAENSLSSQDLKKIYLGKKTRWSDDQKIIFFTSKVDVLHAGFLKRFVKKTPSQFANFWKKQVFTGKGKMPSSGESDAMIVDRVSKTQGAVGYVSKGIQVGSVKTIVVE